MNDLDLLVRIIGAAPSECTPEDIRVYFREAQVLLLSQEGMKPAEIAEQTFLSEKMVWSILHERRLSETRSTTRLGTDQDISDTE